MGSTVRVDGRRTARPGSYGTVDGTALNRRSVGNKRVVLLGTAEGGKPGSVLTDGSPTFLTATTPKRVKALFRSGNLRQAGLAAFDASGDDRVPAGPESVLFYKVNPATQASAVLNNAAGAALNLESVDYGDFTNRISAAVAAGTLKGLALALALEELTEAGDNIGGDPAFDARYDADGEFNTVTLIVDATGVRVTFVDQYVADVVAEAHTEGEAVQVVSASAYDTVQTVTVYGVNAADEPISEAFALNGITAVVGALAFKAVTGARIDGATRGNVSIQTSGGGTDPLAIAAALTADHDSGQEAEVLSADADDTGISIVINGYSPAGAAISETLVLNGTTAVSGAKLFAKITSARLLGACEGNVTVRSETGHSVAFTIAAGSLTAGVNLGDGVHVPNLAAFAGKVSLKHAADPGGTYYAVVRGRSSAGVAAAERILLGADWAESTTVWAQIDHIEIAAGKAATAVDIRGTAINCPVTTHPYLKQVTDAINGAPGFYANPYVDGPQAFGLGRLDHAEASVKGANLVEFLADLDALVVWTNANSELVAATRATGATGAPSVTPAPVYLVGGAEGAATNAHWQAGFDAMKALRGVIVVPLSTGAAVHAMMTAHNRYMSGVGGDERNGYAPHAITLTRAQLRAAIRLLNDKNTCAVAQKVRRYNEQGVAEDFDPWVLATMAASMQAGSDIGEPLTWKRLNAIAVSQNADWDPVDNAEEMLQAVRLMYALADDDAGLLWERSITTHMVDDNPIFTEMSANESANESIRDLRSNLNTQIGSPGFAGKRTVIERLAAERLDWQVDEGIIKAWRALSVTDEGATYPVEYELAAIEPTNFIPITAFLRRIASTG